MNSSWRDTHIFVDLKSDYELLNDATRLQNEGMMLQHASSGRVVFSLQEIPLRITFLTPNQNLLQRVSGNRIYIVTRNKQHKCKIELAENVNYVNKDQFLWGQIQSDLCVLNDEKILKHSGFTIRDQITGNSIKIHSLETLPVGTKYFTENDNLLQRLNGNEVAIGDKIINISKPQDSTSLCSSTDKTTLGEELLVSEVSHILFDKETPGDNSTPNDVNTQGFFFFFLRSKIKRKITFLSFHNNLDIMNKVASLLMESKEFPKITNCTIIGSGYHSTELRVNSTYTGGVEGNSIVRWEKSTKFEPAFIPIKGANARKYTPSISDIGACVRIAYMPVRADGVTGMITFSNIVKVKIHPDIKAEVDSNLAMNTLLFKVISIFLFYYFRILILHYYTRFSCVMVVSFKRDPFCSIKQR